MHTSPFSLSVHARQDNDGDLHKRKVAAYCLSAASIRHNKSQTFTKNCKNRVRDQGSVCLYSCVSSAIVNELEMQCKRLAKPHSTHQIVISHSSTCFSHSTSWRTTPSSPDTAAHAYFYSLSHNQLLPFVVIADNV